MRNQSQLKESIDRFRESFWERRPSDRPPVGVVRREVFMPSLYRRKNVALGELRPEDVGPQLAMSDYEFGFTDRAVSCDDFLAFSAPWRGIPWLEACCGCRVRCAEGSLAPETVVDSIEQLVDLPIPAENGWFACMQRQNAQLLASAPFDCWISPTILRGCSDIIAAMRGQIEFFLDLHDNPELVYRIAGRINRLLLDTLDRHFAAVPPKLGGYAHLFGYWSPGKTLVIQEDVMCSCSAEVYRDMFREYNEKVIEHLNDGDGDYVIFHMHSAGFHHYRDVLSIPGLGGIQMTMDPNGPSLSDMLPVFREVLERSRLILWAKQGCRDLPKVLRRLPKEGLYVIVPDADIASDAAFEEFVGDCWTHSALTIQS